MALLLLLLLLLLTMVLWLRLLLVVLLAKTRKAKRLLRYMAQTNVPREEGGEQLALF